MFEMRCAITTANILLWYKIIQEFPDAKYIIPLGSRMSVTNVSL